MSSDPTFLVTAPTMPQADLHVASVKGMAGAKLTLSTNGGSGSGFVVFVATDGTARGCTITGDLLTAASAGTCDVVATKAASAQYEASTSIAFDSRVAVAPKSLIVHYASTATAMTSSSRAAATVFARQLVKGDVVTLRGSDKGDPKIATTRLNALVALLRKGFRGTIRAQLNARSAASLNTVNIVAAK
jgi:hypothetical protein